MAPLLFPVTIVLALATFLSAQSMVSTQSSASIFIVNADQQPLVGSIVGTNGPATTYQIQCSAGTDPEDCGFPGPFAYTKDGTSIIQYALGLEGVTATVQCSVEGTLSAVCTASGDIPAEELGGSPADADMTTTLLADEFQYTQIPITGGVAFAAASPTRTPTIATSTSPSTQQTAIARSTSPAQSTPSSGQANSTGNTGGATNLDRSSMIALVGAAALAAVLL
ncbi:MAG: hypothetical protein LQ339_005969 [Xanthoria mediterranea]|nr:MAG: hypothetical protein LQ339_005969 [Xanthoria mediterranea]